MASGGSGILLDEPRDPPAGWTVVTANPITQMIWDGSTLPAVTAKIEQMTPADVPEMVALAELTNPARWQERVLEFLATTTACAKDHASPRSQANESISRDTRKSKGVCTHPDFRGHGYAGQLVTLLVKRITARFRNAVPASQDEQRIRAAVRIARLPPAPASSICW